MLLQEHVGHHEHQRMAGMHQHSVLHAWLVHWLDSCALKTNPAVAFQDRLALTPIAPGQASVALADHHWNMGNLNSARFRGDGQYHPGLRVRTVSCARALRFSRELR